MKAEEDDPKMYTAVKLHKDVVGRCRETAKLYGMTIRDYIAFRMAESAEIDKDNWYKQRGELLKTK